MKKLQYLLLFAILLSQISNRASGQLKSTMYLKPLGYSFTSPNYGVSSLISEAAEIKNSIGVGIEMGGLFYFLGDKDRLANVGVDITFIDFNIINQEIGLNFGEYLTPVLEDVYSYSYQLGFGPVLTLKPVGKMTIDIYGKFKMGVGTYGLVSRDSLNNDSSPQFMPRGVGGVSIGYHKAFLNVEYNYGSTNKKFVDDYTSEVYNEFFYLGYFKVSLGIKFSPFKGSNN